MRFKNKKGAKKPKNDNILSCQPGRQSPTACKQKQGHMGLGNELQHYEQQHCQLVDNTVLVYSVALTKKGSMPALFRRAASGGCSCYGACDQAWLLLADFDQVLCKMNEENPADVGASVSPSSILHCVVSSVASILLPSRPSHGVASCHQASRFWCHHQSQSS